MVRDDKTYLDDMQGYCYLIEKQIMGRSRQDLETDVDFRHLLLYRIGVIGEAARQISEEFKIIHPEIEWRKIIGMRNRIHHEYFSVDYDIVWNVVTKEIPELLTRLI